MKIAATAQCGGGEGFDGRFESPLCVGRNCATFSFPADVWLGTRCGHGHDCSYAGPGGLAAALTSGGLVTFACSGTLIVPQISITASTNVVGTGQSVTLSGNLANGVFNVSAGVTLALTNLTIANGTSASGAGVNNAGTLTVTNCTFSGNLANSQGGVGGGIFNTGTATVTNSTFSGNAAEFGGGIYTDSSLALTVTNSTFSDNTSSAVGRNAGNGGAIDNNGITFVINSTFSGNHAAVGGGAIENESAGEVEIFNATFWGNSALAGGGIEDDAADLGGSNGSVLLNGTLLESETSGGNCSGFISDNGYNISDDGSCELGSTSLVELDDSLIPPLQNNGGPTQTIAIPFGSTPSGFIPIADCIKAVSPPSALTTDQRGAPRPTAGNPNFCDAGAYQTQFSIVTNNSRCEHHAHIRRRYCC